MLKPIFLDNQSTTPVDPRVAEVVMGVMLDCPGNPHSSDHAFGTRANGIVKRARKQVQELLNAMRAKVVFTSGATESVNTVIRSVVRNSAQNKKRIILSPLEHKAVIECCVELQNEYDIELDYLSVHRDGSLDVESLVKALVHPADLVCVMAANNEIGNIYCIRTVAELCRKNNVPYLCDATQAAGKIDIDFDEWKIDFLALSAHKIYGPKGVGAIVCGRGQLLSPLIIGGGQEDGKRAGTLNVAGIAGFGEACRLRSVEMRDDEKRIRAYRDKLEQLLKAQIGGIVINGNVEHRLAGNLHVSIPDVLNDAVISHFREELAISRGASCSSGAEEPSHVLRALGMSEQCMDGAFRFGIGKFNSEEDIQRAAALFIDAVKTVKERLCSVS